MSLLSHFHVKVSLFWAFLYLSLVCFLENVEGMDGCHQAIVYHLDLVFCLKPHALDDMKSTFNARLSLS